MKSPNDRSKDRADRYVVKCFRCQVVVRFGSLAQIPYLVGMESICALPAFSGRR